jgi:DNA-binding MarR family transcriptional regulator
MPRSVIDEIKQTRPFRSKQQEAAVAILRTANVLRRRVDAVVGVEGISAAQFNVLRILRGAHGPLPTMEIAERLIEDAPGITRLVNNLEEKGFLRREQWPGDRRQMLCQITAEGLRVLERLDQPMNRLDDSTTGPLSEYHVEQLLYYLDVVREAVREE